MCFKRNGDNHHRHIKYLEVKKSLFASIFSLLIILTVIFVVCYNRCLTIYSEVSDLKGKVSEVAAISTVMICSPYTHRINSLSVFLGGIIHFYLQYALETLATFIVYLSI